MAFGAGIVSLHLPWRRLVAAILPPAKRAIDAAFQVERAMSANPGPSDSCYPHSVVWGVSLAGALLVGFGLSALIHAQWLRRLFGWLNGGVQAWFSKVALAVKDISRVRGRIVQGNAPTYSSVHASPTGTGVAADTGGKKGKNGRRDSTTFTYVNTPASGGRMSLELCMGCVEMNRLMRKIAADTGQKFESEPCDLCKDRARLLSVAVFPSSHIFLAFYRSMPRAQLAVLCASLCASCCLIARSRSLYVCARTSRSPHPLTMSDRDARHVLNRCWNFSNVSAALQRLPTPPQAGTTKRMQHPAIRLYRDVDKGKGASEWTKSKLTLDTAGHV
jgi:hypothetical protein